VRTMIALVCVVCGKKYRRRTNKVKGSKYCSRECAYKGRRTGKMFKCAQCGEAVYKQKSQVQSSKSGLVFCSIKCKNKASRLNGMKEIHPIHFGKSLRYYRNKAFAFHERKCVICGYANHEDVLEVHHRDCNHDNSALSNLAILCPTCHKEVHNGHAQL